MDYAILGLPRSCTAWLSVFMSQSNTYCWHDGFNDCFTLDEYKQKTINCGDSSTGLMIIDFNKEFPSTKTIIIEKNKKEFDRCVEWVDANYPGDNRQNMLTLNDRLMSIKGLRVKQADVFSRLEKIWSYLISDEWNDKYQRLANLNIQINSTKINKKAAESLISNMGLTRL